MATHLRVTPSLGIRMSDMSVADEGASPDELLWEPLLFRVYQRSPEERRPLPSVQGGGDAHLAQQEGEVQDHRAQGGIGRDSGKAGEGSLGTVIRTYVAYETNYRPKNRRKWRSVSGGDFCPDYCPDILCLIGRNALPVLPL